MSYYKHGFYDCPHSEEMRYPIPGMPPTDDPKEWACSGCGVYQILNKDRQGMFSTLGRREASDAE